MCRFIAQLIQPISRDTLIKSCSEANLALCQRVSANQLSQWKSATLWIRNAFVNITQLYKMKRENSPNMIHINIIRGTFSVVIQSTVHHYHHRHYSHLIIIIILIIIIFMVRGPWSSPSPSPPPSEHFCQLWCRSAVQSYQHLFRNLGLSWYQVTQMSYQRLQLCNIIMLRNYYLIITFCTVKAFSLSAFFSVSILEYFARESLYWFSEFLWRVENVLDFCCVGLIVTANGLKVDLTTFDAGKRSRLWLFVEMKMHKLLLLGEKKNQNLYLRSE